MSTKRRSPAPVRPAGKAAKTQLLQNQFRLLKNRENRRNSFVLSINAPIEPIVMPRIATAGRVPLLAEESSSFEAADEN
jgi:hypothetical protein